jgi:hypothetical protein
VEIAGVCSANGWAKKRNQFAVPLAHRSSGLHEFSIGVRRENCPMDNHLYRFRPVDTLVGERQELRRQEIYFASPSELNDPMEGFSDVFWQGDGIAWENLLRHYLVCLERAFSLVLVGGEAHPTTWAQVPVLDPGDRRASTPEHKRLHEEIFAAFFSRPELQAVIGVLVARGGPIRRHELSLPLTSIHHFALLTIRTVFQRRGLVPASAPDEPGMQQATAQLRNAVILIDQIKTVKSNGPMDEDGIDALFGLSGLVSHQMELINFQNNQADPGRPGTNFLAYGFSEGYVAQVERNCYPDWYAACFMESCGNSSIWGTYGDGHKGVCLRFKTSMLNGVQTLTLNRVHGVGIDGPIRAEVPTPFQKVRYSREHSSIDFFASLGGLPQEVLSKYWYTNARGERSASTVAMHANIDEWRQDYWRNFTARTTQKLDDWDYEKEHRLVTYSLITDLSPPEARKAIYRFDDLGKR